MKNFEDCPFSVTFAHMIELIRHIERLLLVHNCVIVPNLGGFVTQDYPARYVKEENLFLPPYRNVAFNPSLRQNDGLLAQSYMLTNGTDYTQTLRDIDHDVAELKNLLEVEDIVELNGIGQLSRLADNRYDFIPYEGGVLTPSFYGLDAFALTPTSHKPNNALTSTFKSSDNYTLSINKRAFHYVAVVVSVIFYFLWAAPLNNVPCRNSQEAQVFQSFTGLLKIPTPQEGEEVPTIGSLSPKTQIVPSNSENSLSIKKEVSSKALFEVERQPFTIVLASQVSQKGAEFLIHQLQGEGFEAVRMVRTRRITRVVYGKYPTAIEAQVVLRKLRHQQELFSEAWVLKLP